MDVCRDLCDGIRQLVPQGYTPGEFTPHPQLVHTLLNARFSLPPPNYAYQAVDLLLQTIRAELSRNGIEQ